MMSIATTEIKRKLLRLLRLGFQLTLTSDIYASARGIEAPALYDTADRGLSMALLVGFALKGTPSRSRTQ